MKGIDGDTDEPLAGAPFAYRGKRGPVEAVLAEDGTARIEGSLISNLRLRRTDEYAGSNLESVVLERGEVKELTLTSTVGATLKGMVVDTGGDRVAGAEVRVWLTPEVDEEPDALVFSEPDGSFRVPRVGPKFVAAAKTESLACRKGLRGEMTPSTRCEGLELVVAPAAALHGTVVDPTGRPIEGAHITLGTGLHSHASHQGTSVPGITWFHGLGGAVLEKVITNANGEFRIEGQPAGKTQVLVEAAGLVGEWITLDTQDSPVTIQLDRGLVVRGRVLFPDGSPAEGARVLSGGVNSTETDERGEFVLSGLEPSEGETAHLTVSLEGFAVAALNPPIYDRGPDSNEIRLERAQPLTGTVRHSSGEPAADILVVLDGGRRFSSENPYADRTRSWESEARVERAKTDAKGRFAFGHRRRGAVRLEVFPSSDHRLWIDVAVAAADENVEVVLDPRLTRKVVLAGRVEDAVTGEPLPEVTLSLWKGLGAMNYTIATEDGEFEFIGLEPAVIGVGVGSPGYVRVRQPDRAFELGEHDLGTLRLVPAIDVNLLIVDEYGKPWTEGALGVLGADGEPVAFSFSSAFRSTRTRLRGVPLVLGELPAEPLTLTLEADNVTQEIPFDPRLHTGPDVVELTVEKPSQAQQATVFVALIRRGAVDSTKTVEAAMRTTLLSNGRSWAAKPFEAIIAAGPRSELVLEATSSNGLPSQARVNWDPAKQVYSQTIKNTSRASFRSSSWSSETTEFPLPFVRLSPRMRSQQLELRLLDGETVLVEHSLLVDRAQGPAFVVLEY
ncbi:MAG: carboxypeptidase-like regulatory domain-containing protein [Planctomycetota bacterium]